METKILKDDEKGIKTAAEILKSGGIVAIPTETVYGLAASAYSDEAIEKVFLAKGRPQDNPLIVHISNIEEIDNIVSQMPGEARELAERFWPGPLTMVLPRTDRVSPRVSAGLSTVAVRMPENEVARRIIRECGIPLAAPSANLSGNPSPTTADHVIADLSGRIDAVVVSGHSSVGVESTVVSLAVNPPRLLRPGKITAEELRDILPDLVIDKAVLSEIPKGEKAASPGMMYKHYSPKTEVYLVEAEGDEFVDFLNEKTDVAAICFKEDAEKLHCPILSIGAAEDEEEQARLIFERLRESDSLGVKTVYVHAPKKSGVGLAVYNRLIRAAGFKIIRLKTIVGLTGPTGAGKTSACRVAEDMGYTVINCDKVAREATKDADCLKALSEAFGVEILNSDNTLNRKALAEKAFKSSDKTELLNKTIFPYITRLIEGKIENAETGKVLLDAPTLYESGIDRICTVVIAVLADRDVRLSRILSRDGIEKSAALLRINAGKPDEFYKERTNHVICNNGGEQEFTARFAEVLKRIGGQTHE